jgi:hypothetical protein
MQRYQPALLGGLFIGVLSSLPIVSAANVCCCLWVVAGGLLTAYLQQQAQPTPLDAAEAALGGLIAGCLGALLSLLVSAVVLTGTSAGAGLEETFRDMLDRPEVPSEVRDRVVGAVAGRGFLMIIGAVTLPVYAVFGMLGALLGRAFFKKQPPPTVPPEVGSEPRV